MPPDNPLPIILPFASQVPTKEGFLELLHDLNLASSRLQLLLCEALIPAGLTPSELFLLWQLGERPDSFQHELAAGIGISPAQMSSLVERLRQRDLLSVERSETDRRRQHLRLTTNGQQKLAAVTQSLRPLAEIVDRQMAIFSPLRFSQVCRTLSQITAPDRSEERGAA